MSDISGSESGSEYLPGASEEEDSDDSDFSDIEFDSDEEFSDENEPVVEDGWQYMSDPYSDARPDPLPLVTAAPASLASCVPHFSSPHEAFRYYFDDELIDKMCTWMNKRAAEYFRTTGKRKVHGLIWKDVEAKEMYVFISLLIVMGIVKFPRMHMYWSHGVQLGGPRVFCKVMAHQ